MLGFLRELTCKHEFEKIKEVEVYGGDQDKLPYKRILLFMCKNCGKVKKIVIK